MRLPEDVRRAKLNRMNARLQTLIAEAESLPEPEQDLLADMIADFLMEPEEAAKLSLKELAEVDAMLAKPLELADPTEVTEVFARYGQG